MSADRIKGQCRGICILSCNSSGRNKSQFDHCLETVADTKCQSVSLTEHIFNSFPDLGVTEGCCKELGTSIRFITC